MNGVTLHGFRTIPLVAVCVLWADTIASAQRARIETPSPIAKARIVEVVGNPTKPATDELSSQSTLTEDSVIAEVLARNPSIDQMVAAWQALQFRGVQDRALDDPTIASTLAPDSIGSNLVDTGYRIEVSQKFYAPGKRRLRGESAASEALAAEREVELMRLEMAVAAREAFFDYFLARRAIEINEEGQGLLQQFRSNAETRFQTGQSLQQDVLQAEVEIGRQQEKRLGLKRRDAVSRARLNVLMHRPPGDPLPPPPHELSPPPPLPDIRECLERAIRQRPELQAMAHRIEGERARMALAAKEYRPDFEVFGGYDAFWQAPEDELRGMVGVRVNVPVRREKRAAALSEAGSRLAERVAEYEREVDQIRLEVMDAYEQVAESDGIVQLYSESVLRSAEQSVKLAASAYASDRADFMTLVDAQRNLVDLRDRYYEAVADAHKRRARLQRVLGDPVN